MSIFGKNVYLMMGVSSANVDLTDSHGLEVGDFVVDGEPIPVPTQGDILQFEEAAQQGLTIPISVLADSDEQTPVIDPIFWPAAGKTRHYDFGLAKGTGNAKHTGTGILTAVTASVTNDGLVRYSTSIRINTWVAGTQ